MKVVFRTDASLAIGNGHLMRCLTLAVALRERGAICKFVCREHEGHRNDLVEAHGFALCALPMPAAASPALQQSGYAGWLGCHWTEDAARTVAALGGDRPDWLVVDHYALDAEWERAMRSSVHRIMVIDDLADRMHDADLLLDQNQGRLEGDYASLVPAGCRVLVGARHALLRPEFVRYRPSSLERRRHPRLRRLLIAMGGVDADNATGAVLDALSTTDLPADCHITIALGSRAPWREAVRERASGCARPCKLRLDVADMGELLAECDLAIGAAGASAWERCCLGLPSALVVLAGNQLPVAKALAEAGGASLVGGIADIPVHLPGVLATMSHPEAMAQMSKAAAELCDGMGLARVLDHLLPDPEAHVQPGCTVRPMVAQDLEQVLEWRNHPDIRRHMYTHHEIGMAEHRAWFERSVADPGRHLLIAEAQGQALGFVHFRQVDTGRVADWGFYAVPHAPKGSGRRLGNAALRYAFGMLGLHKVCGQALESNERSIALHCALGFSEEGRLREQHFDGRHYRAVLCFGLLASEWQRANRENEP